MIKTLTPLLLIMIFCSPAVAERKDVKNEKPLANGPTYGRLVEIFCEAYVFPPSLKYKGVGVDRDNVIAERVERDGNNWYITVRSRYSGRIAAVGVAERVRVKYDNGAVAVDLGKLKGVINTKALKERWNIWLGKNAGRPTTRDRLFHLKTSHGKYVTATPLNDAAKGHLRQANDPGKMETFVLTWREDGKYNIRTSHGQYITATPLDDAVRGELRQAKDPGRMETFEFIPVKGKSNFFNIRTTHGQYVTATPLDDAAKGHLRQANDPGKMETFELIPKK